MNRTYFLIAAGLLCQALSLAQTEPAGQAYQLFYSTTAQLAGGRGAMPTPQSEVGKPFSATATTQSTQILADGTHVNQTTTMVEYRDAEGRVRTEAGEPMAMITIRDPVAQMTTQLNPASKLARKVPTVQFVARASSGFGGRGGSGGRGGRGGSGAVQIAQAVQGVIAQFQPQLVMDNSVLRYAGPANKDIVEDLGTMSINGVSARGTRTTTIVPEGAIGNDRPFHSISERWFSSDLNLLVKSVSSDPRFGTTTYELTNISRLPPDPSLFQIPADYDVKVPPGK